jgi:hypothetical protein
MSLRLKMIQMRMTEPDPSIWVRGPVGQRKRGGPDSRTEPYEARVSRTVPLRRV